MRNEINDSFADELVARALLDIALQDPPPGIHAAVMCEIKIIPQTAAPLNFRAIGAALALSLALLVAGLSFAQFWIQRLATPETALLLNMEAWYWIQRIDYLVLLVRQEMSAFISLLGRQDMILAWGLLSISIGSLLLTGLGIGFQIQSHLTPRTEKYIN